MDGSGFGGAVRVAVLVDGDNIRALHQGAIMAEAARLGRADVRRVYGGAAHCLGWDGFRIVHAAGAKNAADMHLVVDAMELALSAGVEAFVIASMDVDFAPLALFLRERGVPVTGIGEAQAAARFRAACSRFVEVEERAEPGVKAALPALAPLHRVALDVVRTLGGAESEVTMVTLGARLGKVPEGRTTWRSVLAEREDLFAFVGQGKDAKVRLTPAGAKVR